MGKNISPQQITHIPMAVSFERFCELSYQLTGDLMEVPQLGLKAKTALEHEGIRSTHHLLARWLEVRKSANAQARFKEWLDVKGAPRTHSGRIASSIAERVAKVGIKLQVELSEQIVKSSRIDDDKARAIASRTFNNILEHDFQGCGFGSPDKPSAAVDALRLAGIDSTDKLFAAFLKKFDSAPTSEKATEFWSDLGKIEGFKAHGYKSTIVEALKIRLENGIDCPRVISRHQPTLAPGRGSVFAAGCGSVLAAGCGSWLAAGYGLSTIITGRAQRRSDVYSRHSPRRRCPRGCRLLPVVHELFDGARPRRLIIEIKHEM